MLAFSAASPISEGPGYPKTTVGVSKTLVEYLGDDDKLLSDNMNTKLGSSGPMTTVDLAKTLVNVLDSPSLRLNNLQGAGVRLQSTLEMAASLAQEEEDGEQLLHGNPNLAKKSEQLLRANPTTTLSLEARSELQIVKSNGAIGPEPCAKTCAGKDGKDLVACRPFSV